MIHTTFLFISEFIKKEGEEGYYLVESGNRFSNNHVTQRVVSILCVLVCERDEERRVCRDFHFHIIGIFFFFFKKRTNDNGPNGLKSCNIGQNFHIRPTLMRLAQII